MKVSAFSAKEGGAFLTGEMNGI